MTLHKFKLTIIRIFLTAVLLLMTVCLSACKNKEDENSDKVVGDIEERLDNGLGDMKDRECAEEIWELLKTKNIVPENSQLISVIMDKNERYIELDVDMIFGEFLRGQGISGEQEIIKGVVNTFLDEFDCLKIKITEEGKTLVSGHKEYAGYLSTIAMEEIQ